MFFRDENPNALYWLTIFTISLYIVSLFFNLHVAPLSLEEPRRALVALEMLLNDNYIVTTILDKTFYDHPPLWNIVLAGSIKIFGYNVFALRFPSAFSLLLTGIITFLMGNKYFDRKFGILSSLYYLICADLYFFFSLTAEIDIFYSLLIILSQFSIFYFYQKKQFYKLFGYAYLFTTLAFLTKGVASYAFIGVTLIAYFAHRKDFKRLFSLPHILFCSGSIAFIGIYFYVLGQYEDVNTYIAQMWGLTSQRTLLNDRFDELIGHLFLFPLNFLGVLFPATLFILFLWKKGQLMKIAQQPYLLFLTIAFLANFLVYWISPGARIRYTYMFFPMVIALLVYPMYLQMGTNNWRNKTYHTFFQILIAIVAIVCFIIPFLGYFSILPHLKYTMPLVGLSLFGVFFLHRKTDGLTKHLFLINFIIICRLTLDHVALPLKAQVSSGAPHKTYAYDIREIIGDDGPIYLFSQEEFNIHHQIPFRFYETAAYLELWRKSLVIQTQQCELEGYYIFNVDNLEAREPLYLFCINDMDLALVKIGL